MSDVLERTAPAVLPAVLTKTQVWIMEEDPRVVPADEVYFVFYEKKHNYFSTLEAAKKWCGENNLAYEIVPCE